MPLIERAEGSLLHCADGSTLIDGISSWWVTTHGHCHPRIAAAIAEQAGRLDQLIFAGHTHEPAEEVARGLLGLAPAGLTRVFRSEEHTSELQSLMRISYAVFCLKKQTKYNRSSSSQT